MAGMGGAGGIGAAFACGLVRRWCFDHAGGVGPAGQATVVWISMDGVRADYLDRTELPFFARLQKEGAYSRRFQPVFPPITFPSHCAEATGVSVARHGIPGNSFYDAATGTSYHVPADASLLQAEPIWLTAARQGVRTLVFDWPLSQKERGARFTPTIPPRPSMDRPPIRRVWTICSPSGREDAAKTALVPAESETKRAAVAPADGLRGSRRSGRTQVWAGRAGDRPRAAGSGLRAGRVLRTGSRAVEAPRRARRPLLPATLTTDHGMSRVDKVVNAEKLLSLPHGQREITVEAAGNLANVYLDHVPDGSRRGTSARRELLDALCTPIRSHGRYRRADLPAAWEYAHPTRTGDLVIVLPKGYAFNKQAPEAVVDASRATDGPLGMHGYPVEDDPEMYGVTLLWRFPRLLNGKDLGAVNWNQLHPTVARLLGHPGGQGGGGAAHRIARRVGIKARTP